MTHHLQRAFAAIALVLVHAAPAMWSRAFALDLVNPVTDASFDKDVLKASEPVLVFFQASWCGPCRMMTPPLDVIAKEMAGKVKFVKLDVDESPEAARRYRVSQLPTLIVFKGGDVAANRVGAVPDEARLRAWIGSKI